MTKRNQLAADRVDALLRLIADSGASAAGEVPAEYVEALQMTREVRQANEVAQAHRENREPPSFSNAGGRS